MFLPNFVQIDPEHDYSIVCVNQSENQSYAPKGAGPRVTTCADACDRVELRFLYADLLQRLRNTDVNG